LQFALVDASPGDQIIVYDALNLQPAAVLRVPENKIYEGNTRARLVRMQNDIASLRDFLSKERPHPPEMAAVIDFPRFLEIATAQLRRADEPLRVVVIASPFYANATEPAYNMEEAYPSDAHINADQHDSVYGTALKKNALNGVTVHYAYLRQCFVNSFHQERIMRFWSLFVQENQHGILATFAPDPSLAFQRARDNIQEPVVQAEIDPNNTKIEMQRVTPRAIPVWFGPTNFIQNAIVSNLVLRSSSEVSTPAPPTNRVLPQTTSAVSAAPASGFPVAPKTNILGIGLMWGANADIDLHVIPNKSARELYYGYTQSKEGKYFLTFARPTRASTMNIVN
jgi:hypothetical protein